MSVTTRRSFVLQTSAATLLAASSLQAQAALAVPVSRPSALRFGVNYVPRKNWFYSWQDWDRQAVADDLHAIASLGMDHIRAHILWPLFQPGINYVSEVMLERLRTLLDLADHAGLDVKVTVLNGWMSGMSFLPAWIQPLSGGHNLFADDESLRAEELLFTKLAGAVGSHRRFLGFDLGNELPVLQTISQPIASAQADAWSTRMLSLCEKLAPGKLHVNGVDHKPWFRDFGFTRQNLATAGGATILHAYGLFTGTLKRFGFAGTGSKHLVDYMTEFAYAYQTDLTRKIWLEEVGVAGASPEFAREEEMPAYMESLVRNGVATGKLWGVTWWGSHDIDAGMKGFARLEYPLGLIGQDNKVKPLGKKFAALAEELRKAPQAESKRTTALVVPEYGLGASLPTGPDWQYGDKFMKLVEQGTEPAIVLESRAKDETYLKARGIRELIPFREVKA